MAPKRKKPKKAPRTGSSTATSTSTTSSATGATGRQYADPKFIPLAPGQFYTGDVSQYDAYAGVLQSVPKPRPGASLIMNLEDVLGADAMNAITQAGKLVFHSVGDTGADKQYRIKDEDDVAAMMAQDLAIPDATERPAFFYHLGDVIYEFGQDVGYYPQFYEPYCRYNAPIFAIPGNHDGMVWDPSMQSLKAFLANFCAPAPGPAPNAAGLVRTTMNQPGVYFTLEAPFVSIIGLYSNIVDKGPGVISSENNKYPVVGDDQKKFLISELKRIAAARKQNPKALIVALHHPPYMGSDLSTKPLCNDLDDAFKQGGLWPDLVLSGHAHIYQRFARAVNGINLPYIVAGCGGYNLSPYNAASSPAAKVPPAMAGKDPTLKAYIKAFGYLKLKAAPGKLAVIFNCLDASYGPAADSIVIDLKTHAVTEGQKGKEPL